MSVSPRTRYLLISVALLLIAFSVILVLILATSLPYTTRPLQQFPLTPTYTPAN